MLSLHSFNDFSTPKDIEIRLFAFTSMTFLSNVIIITLPKVTAQALRREQNQINLMIVVFLII